VNTLADVAVDVSKVVPSEYEIPSEVTELLKTSRHICPVTGSSGSLKTKDVCVPPWLMKLSKQFEVS
jgi:hypothetical protein